MAWHTNLGMTFMVLVGVGGFTLGTFDIYMQKARIENKLQQNSEEEENSKK